MKNSYTLITIIFLLLSLSFGITSLKIKTIVCTNSLTNGISADLNQGTGSYDGVKVSYTFPTNYFGNCKKQISVNITKVSCTTVKAWVKGKTYSILNRVIYNNALFESNSNNNTDEPNLANTCLSKSECSAKKINWMLINGCIAVASTVSITGAKTTSSSLDF